MKLLYIYTSVLYVHYKGFSRMTGLRTFLALNNTDFGVKSPYKMELLYIA